MMATLGEAKIKIRAVLGPLRRSLKTARSITVSALKGISSAATSGIRGALKGVSSLVSGIVKIILSGIKLVITAIKKLVQIAVKSAKIIAVAMAGIGVASVKMAADVQESESLFNVSLGKMGDAVRKWSNTLSDALGLNRFEVRKFVSIFNNMLKSLGFGIEDAAKMSTQLTKLAFDMASFFNMKPDEAFLKLSAGITGEIEPLKRLGILINETTVKNFALTNGITRQKEALTELEKVQIRIALINEQTVDAQGDLKRTFDSTTNVFRTIKSLVTELAIELGNSLDPAVAKLAMRFRDFLINNKDALKEWAAFIGVKFTEIVGTITEFAETALPKMKTKIIEAFGKFKEWLQITKDFVMEWGPVVIGVVSGAIATVRKIITDFISAGQEFGFGNVLSALADNLGEMLVNGIKIGIDKITEFIKGNQEILNVGVQIGTALGEGIAKGIRGNFGKTATILSGLGLITPTQVSPQENRINQQVAGIGFGVGPAQIALLQEIRNNTDPGFKGG